MIPSYRGILLSVTILSVAYCSVQATFNFYGDFDDLEKFMDENGIDSEDPVKNLEAALKLVDAKRQEAENNEKLREKANRDRLYQLWLAQKELEDETLADLDKQEAGFAGSRVTLNDANAAAPTTSQPSFTADNHHPGFRTFSNKLSKIRTTREKLGKKLVRVMVGHRKDSKADQKEGDEEEDETANLNAEELAEREEKHIEDLGNVWRVVDLLNELAQSIEKPCTMEALVQVIELTARTINYSDGTARKSDKIAAHYLPQAFKHCQHFMKSSFTQSVEEASANPTVIDKLTKEDIIKHLDLKNGKPAEEIPMDKMVAIFRQLTAGEWNAVYTKKKYSILKFSSKIVANEQNFSRVWDILMVNCRDQVENGLGFFATVTPALKAYAPEQYNDLLDAPKLFENNMQLYEVSKLRANLCNSFLDLNYDQQNELLELILQNDKLNRKS